MQKKQPRRERSNAEGRTYIVNPARFKKNLSAVTLGFFYVLLTTLAILFPLVVLKSARERQVYQMIKFFPANRDAEKLPGLFVV